MGTTLAQDVELLRLATAGSVDDGKSTLVGRLLHDANLAFTDQLEAVEAASRDKGLHQTDLALLTDGLRAERDQGITIDVAYRYFATSRRRFILADTPGHVQYTRNMVTGASTAQLAVVLVDARHGMVDQTRRHAAIAALLQVPHVVLAVNKMDLVGHDQAAFAAIDEEFRSYSRLLGIADPVAIPVSALHGDNIVEPSHRMGWYGGSTLLEHLETVAIDADRSAEARFPVQYVIRPRTAEYRDYRGYAGRLESGTLALGDEVVVLPSGRRSTIVGLDVLGEQAEEVVAGQSLSVLLADDIDVSRGDLIAPAPGAPTPTRDVSATVCHFADRPLRIGDRVLMKHGTRTTKAIIRELTYRLDHGSSGREANPPELAANDIGAMVLHTAEPLALDAYAANRHTGSFILIDESDGATLTAGMVTSTEKQPGGM